MLVGGHLSVQKVCTKFMLINYPIVMSFSHVILRRVSRDGSGKIVPESDTN